IGWFIGRWVAQVVERVLPATGFDRSVSSATSLARNQPVEPAATTAPYAGDVTPATAAALGATAAPTPMTPSRVVGKLVMAAIVAFTAIEAARLLEFATLAATVEEILGLAGRVIVGGV